jgi:ferredoxin-type protein NapH
MTKTDMGITCTNCGDCLSACHVQALQYQFFKLGPEKSGKLYLSVVVIIFTLFFAVART